jgi:RnfABCDGE-type electron transport complex B subunit
MVLLVMLVIGAFFGLILAFVNKKFAMEVNPLIHMVEDVLPKGQCGACGFPGCMAYAEAVVEDPDVAPNLCAPGKAVIAEMVAEMTGKAAPPMEPRIAHVRCNGTLNNATAKYQYKGVEDCVAANILQGGQKACTYGCLGFGTCVKNCPFGAMSMSDSGLPIIDPIECTGCGRCAIICPKSVIEMGLIGAKVTVNWKSKDTGAVAKRNCTVSCIGCGLCSKNCEHGAVKVANALASIDAAICMAKCTSPTCMDKCPTKAIEKLLLGKSA